MTKAKFSYTEEQLVEKLKAGDAPAFRYLYDNYSSVLYGVICRIVNNDETAQDVLQEAFVRIWKNFSQYDASKGRLFTWILNVARNLAIDHLRSHSHKQQTKNQRLDDSVNLINLNEKVSSGIDHIGLREVISKLKPEYVTVINMAYFGGYTQEEMAKELNLPLGTVKTRIRTALMHLRDLMQVKQ